MNKEIKDLCKEIKQTLVNLNVLHPKTLLNETDIIIILLQNELKRLKGGFS